MFYRTCPNCRSNNDHGEVCDCDQERLQSKKTKQTNTPIATAPLTHENALIQQEERKQQSACIT